MTDLLLDLPKLDGQGRTDYTLFWIWEKKTLKIWVKKHIGVYLLWHDLYAQPPC